MTLKEKLRPREAIQFPYEANAHAGYSEKIADDFAIDFAEWKHYNSTFITRHPTKGLLFSIGLDNELYDLKQLLIKFKQETGL